MFSALRNILFACGFLFALNGYSQKSWLTGKAKTYANQTLRAYVYDDFLTLKEKQIAETSIDSSGTFKLALPISNTEFVFLKTESTRSSLYVEPNKNYFISIPKLDAQEYASVGVQAFVALKINSADSLELNTIIAKFENYLDAFYQKNLALLARKAIKKEAEKFKTSMEKRFAFSKNSYFKNYIKYKIATLEAAGGYSEHYFFKNYFNAKIEYESLEYMQFFSQFMTKHLEQLAGTSKGAAIETNISQKRNYSAVMADILKADSLFKNDTLRELLLLKGLNEFYYMPKINKRNVLSLLSFIERSGKGKENKKIAHNTIYLLTKMAEGTKAPAFSLTDLNKKTVSLSDFKGKYVYLDFWASWCMPCLQEMKLKQNLKDKYSSDIAFVSISIDKNYKAYKSYLDKNKNLNSVFLYGGNADSLRELFNVKAIPAFYLIDKDGDLLKSPAKKPSENIEELFQQLSKEK